MARKKSKQFRPSIETLENRAQSVDRPLAGAAIRLSLERGTSTSVETARRSGRNANRSAQVRILSIRFE